MLHWCLNWRVLAPLAAAGIALWLVAPGVAAIVLLVAALVACGGCKLMLIKRLHARAQARKAAKDAVPGPHEPVASHR